MSSFWVIGTRPPLTRCPSSIERFSTSFGSERHRRGRLRGSDADDHLTESISIVASAKLDRSGRRHAAPSGQSGDFAVCVRRDRAQQAASRTDLDRHKAVRAHEDAKRCQEHEGECRSADHLRSLRTDGWGTRRCEQTAATLRWHPCYPTHPKLRRLPKQPHKYPAERQLRRNPTIRMTSRLSVLSCMTFSW